MRRSSTASAVGDRAIVRVQNPVRLDRRVVEVYRDPARKGYRDLAELRDGALSPLAFPDLVVPVADLLG